MTRFLIGLFLSLIVSACANAQSSQTQCNSPSGFLKAVGPFSFGDPAIFGPDCQSLQSGVGVSNSKIYLLSPTGNDTNDCISNPCRSLPHIASLINNAGALTPVTIMLAAGSYTPGAIFKSGNISIIGAGSGVTTISDNTSNGAAIMSEFPAQVGISGVYITTVVGSDVWALYGGIIYINSDVIFGPAPTARLYCQDNGAVYGNANFTIDGGAGSLAVFLLSHCGMRFFGGPPVLTFTNSPIFNTILDGINGCTFKSGAMQFNGGASVTSSYTIDLNCIVDQEQNATQWPGSQGTVSGGAVFYNSGAAFTGAISGTVLTVTGLPAGNGALGIGNEINGAGITPHTLKIASFGTGTGLNGTYNLNVSGGTITAEPMSSSSIFPCIDSVSLCPVVLLAPTGLGVGGTATVSNDGFGGDYGGIVSLKTGSSGTASSGAVSVILHSSMQNCSVSASTIGSALTFLEDGLGTTAGFRWLQIVWSNSAALAINTTYAINYICR